MTHDNTHVRTAEDGYDCVTMLAWEYLQHRFVKDITPRLSSLLEAPAGCANFLSFNHSMLAEGFIAQEDIACSQEVSLVRKVFGARIALTPDSAPIQGYGLVPISKLLLQLSSAI